MRPFLILLAIFTVFYIGATYYLSGLIMHTPDRDYDTVKGLSLERWHFDMDSALATLPPYEEVTFPSELDDGGDLYAWYFRQPGDTASCGVVLSHGYSMNRADMLKYTNQFNQCGCDLLMYDHRGHGKSYEAPAGGGYLEAADLLQAHRYLSDNSRLTDQQIGWFGESWGAATALQAAGLNEIRPAWVVAESPYEDWRTAVTERGRVDYGAVLDFFIPGTFAWFHIRNGFSVDDASTMKRAAKIEVPVLLLHSGADDFTTPIQSAHLAEVMDPDILTYRELDWGAWHAHNIIVRRGEYEQLVSDFIGICASKVSWPQRAHGG